MSIKNIFTDSLGALGIKVSRQPYYAADNRFIPKCYISRSELKTVHALIERALASKDSGLPSQWSVKEICDYMSLRRLSRQNDFSNFILSSNRNFDKNTVLDVGCGMGYLLRVIGNHNADMQLIGFDPSLKSKFIAPVVCPTGDFYNAQLNLTSNINADLVIASQVLEHLENPQVFCELLKANASQTASFYFSIPDGRIDSLSAGWHSSENKSYTGHINFWSPESFSIFLESVFVDFDVKIGISEWGDIFASVEMMQ